MTTFICCACDTHYASEDRVACGKMRRWFSECDCECHDLPYVYVTVWGTFFFPPETAAS